MLNIKTLTETISQIKDTDFHNLLNQDLKRIILLLEVNGIDVRIVGGAVRDFLLNQKPRDIDLICDASPDKIIFILSDAGYAIDSSGIQHGTLKIIIDDIKYEITSADYSIRKTKKGKIVIHKQGSWEKDAKRRDFTINSLSMDLDGKIYDYCDGIKDLKNEMIRPLNNFDKKIKNDPVLILRFFKMLAKFKHPKFSKITLNIIKKNLNLIKNIKSKRLNRELLNISESINGEKVKKLMEKIGLMKILDVDK